jgi:hypothetical protein
MKPNKGVLTVGELKELLSKYSDSTQIVVASEDWYVNISEVIEPDDDGIYAITFYTTDDFDPRQF